MAVAGRKLSCSATTRQGEQARTILGKIISGASGGGEFIVGGPISAIAGYVGSEVVGAMRPAGIETIDDMMADALLNPGRAKLLLSKAGSPQAEPAP